MYSRRRRTRLSAGLKLQQGTSAAGAGHVKLLVPGKALPNGIDFRPEIALRNAAKHTTPFPLFPENPPSVYTANPPLTRTGKSPPLPKISRDGTNPVDFPGQKAFRKNLKDVVRSAFKSCVYK